MKCPVCGENCSDHAEGERYKAVVETCAHFEEIMGKFGLQILGIVMADRTKGPQMVASGVMGLPIMMVIGKNIRREEIAGLLRAVGSQADLISQHALFMAKKQEENKS